MAKSYENRERNLWHSITDFSSSSISHPEAGNLNINVL